MHEDDMGREYRLDLGAGGELTYKHKSAKVDMNYGIPVFTVDTEKEAQSLQVHFGKLAYDGETYLIPGVTGQVEDLDRVEKMLKEHYDTKMKRRKDDE